MGILFSAPQVWEVTVRTGDRKRAGTNCDVTLIVEGAAGERSLALALRTPMHNDLERGQSDTYVMTPEVMGSLTHQSELAALTISSAGKGLAALFGPQWFVDCIEVRNIKTYDTYIFPVLRWLNPGQSLSIALYDTSLPMHERHPEQRSLELTHKKCTYVYKQNIDGIQQVATVPSDEQFTFNYSFDIKFELLSMGLKSKVNNLCNEPEFESLAAIEDIYQMVDFPVPSSVTNWRSDVYFGQQRLSGLNPNLITLVANEIPDKLQVSNELLGPLLEGHSIESAIENKKLYIVDFDILHDFPLPDKDKALCAPIGLFFVNKKEQLLPIAIQLYQEPAHDNPVFTPQDPEPLWCLVKFWFNNADAAVHQAVTHLGNTHLMMEGVVVGTHRTLSPSHPVFKLLAPHFLFLIAINDLAIKGLVNEGGWVDKVMTYGGKGITNLAAISRGRWRMDVQGTPPRDLEARGVADAETTLPGYAYRDDVVDVYQAIHKYVKDYVAVSYPDLSTLEKDTEIQEWGRELVAPMDQGGLALAGVPGNGEFKTFEQLTDVVASVIFTCSAGHAAANFLQYDQYGYPPAYPISMRGSPPKTKDMEVNESTLLAALPDRQTTLDTMVVTQVLSQKSTKSLGDFEIQYVAEPRALAVLDRFRADLERISEDVANRNRMRIYKYDVLDPKSIPNAISI